MDKENVVPMCAMENYSTIKKNEIMSFAGGKWIEMEIIM
jgi:hypothetical protein